MARLILFNKPYDVLSQFTDSSIGADRRTLSDFIDVPRVYPAGRLDRDISNPRFKTPKTYLVQVEGDVTPDALACLRAGVSLKDGPTLPAEAERIDPPTLWPRDPPVRFRKTVPDCWISLTIREGRNRQVRRMTAAVGHPTLRLVRWRIGDWTLDGVAPGTWRDMPI